MRVRALPEAKALLLVPMQHTLGRPQALPSPNPILVSPSPPQSCLPRGPTAPSGVGRKGN